MMLDGQSAINAQPFLLLSPAICVALIVLAFTFLGDGLRDALDPRMRGTQ
jgi:oligopeptide transport system permease protein